MKFRQVYLVCLILCIGVGIFIPDSEPSCDPAKGWDKCKELKKQYEERKKSETISDKLQQFFIAIPIAALVLSIPLWLIIRMTETKKFIREEYLTSIQLVQATHKNNMIVPFPSTKSSYIRWVESIGKHEVEFGEEFGTTGLYKRLTGRNPEQINNPLGLPPELL
jgi:hypothetical protein